MVTQRIQVAIDKVLPALRLKMRQSDSGRIIRAEVYDSDMPFDMAGYLVEFRAKKPDGTVIVRDEGIEVDGNVAIVSITANTLAVDGLVRCELVIADDQGIVIGTAIWEIEVTEAAVPENELVSQSDYQSVVAYAATTKAFRDEAGQYAADASSSGALAKQSEQEAARLAGEAADDASEAKQHAQAAAASAASIEGDATAAANSATEAANSAAAAVQAQEAAGVILGQVEDFAAGDMATSTYDPAGGAKQVAFEDEVMPAFSGAGPHNSIFRGKFLGDAVTAEQWAAISSGTFDDLFIGDYWTIGGVNYRIAAFDYYYNTGDTACATHHAVIVPDAGLYNAMMNATNITTGGYAASAMRATRLAQAKTTVEAAFPGHVLNHRQLLTNTVDSSGQPSAWAWFDSEVELMNEVMVYGSVAFGASSIGASGHNVGCCNCQLPLFAHRHDLAHIGQNYWLRDVCSDSHFARVGGGGHAGYSSATGPFAVRPVFSIC